MRNNIKTLFLFIVVSVCSVSPASSAVVVYTDLTAWNAAIYGLNGDNHLDDLESNITGGLSAGFNNLGYFANYIYISGAPGYNAIDDSFTSDPFLDAMSPDGSTYYLGHVETYAIEPTLGILDMDRSVIAFGADWVISGDLFMEFGGASVYLGDYLPTGSGFLGMISDQGQGEFAEINFSGSAVFGIDNIRVGAVVPVPSAIWLFGSGLLGLIGIRSGQRK